MKTPYVNANTPKFDLQKSPDRKKDEEFSLLISKLQSSDVNMQRIQEVNEPSPNTHLENQPYAFKDID